MILLYLVSHGENYDYAALESAEIFHSSRSSTEIALESGRICFLASFLRPLVLVTDGAIFLNHRVTSCTLLYQKSMRGSIVAWGRA